MVVGEFTQEAELVVIGGGPGGYAAAFRAAELGVGAVIVDPRPALGGVCLHEGCIPSKSLLHVAESMHRAEQCREYGIEYQPPRMNLDRLRAWKDATIETLASGLATVARRHGVEHVRGRACFEDSRTLTVIDGAVPRIRFRSALIATGSRARAHDVLEFDGERVLRPTEATAIPDVPARLLVIGNQYMTIELAGIYQSLGSAVMLVDQGDRLLPEADPDLFRPLERSIRSALAGLHLGTSVTASRRVRDGIEITFEGAAAPAPAVFDRVIVAIGQVANLDSVHAERAGVALDANGFVTVDEQLRTANRRIYAAGDVTGPPLLADRALHQGRVAAESIAGWKSIFEPRAVPFAVFSDPQIAWCGLTEAEATREGIPYAVSKTPWGASGRAVSIGRAQGVTKIIYDPDTSLVLGVGLAGPQAAELIAEGALAIEMGAELEDLAATMHPHPTLSETLADTARAAAGSPEPSSP